MAAATSSNEVVKLSHSMPSGVDSTGLTTSAISGAKKPARNIINVKIQLLDNSVSVFQIQHKVSGRVLFDQACKMLNLLESDYFGLEYFDQHKTKYWLDPEKQMNRQIGLTLIDPLLRFCVKFYTPDPAQLEEPYTRYLFALQIKYDLADGSMQCNDNTSALMASFIIQAECGDYMEEDYPDHGNISASKFVPHQDAELEQRIMDSYKKHRGQTPEVADLNLLEIARRCELYGIKMSKAKDHDGMPLSLAVAHMGILVFQNYTKINTFSWAKIRKLSFKKKRFLIKLHPEGYGYYKDTVEFFFESRNECKNFWKKCIEHHGFFRCSNVQKAPKPKARVFSRGSSFRYSGKTQKEVVEYVRSNFIKRQPFQRSASFKVTRTPRQDLHPTMGRSISTHLPISESEQNFAQQSNMVSTPVSQSCGSVTLTDKSGDELSPSRELPMDTPTNVQRATKAPPTDFDLPPPSYIEVTTKMAAVELRPIPESPTIDEVVSSIPPPESEDFDVPEATQEAATTTNNFSESPVLMSPTDSFDFPSSPTKFSKKSDENPAYSVLKELLMTERTHKKDLEVISVWFREAVEQVDGMPEDLLFYLFSHIDPLCEFHEKFLEDVKERLKLWELNFNLAPNSCVNVIGDVFIENLPMLKLFNNYTICHEDVVDRLHTVLAKSKKFESVYKNFELQKVCYLPLTVFLLKPAQRILHYQLLLERLVQHYPLEHEDAKDCLDALEQIRECVEGLLPSINKTENSAKLFELQRDLVGFDGVFQPKRMFLREGRLQKYSKKGFQQRIFFLFSDVLVYANKVSSTALQFKVHGYIPVSGMTVESSESKLGANHCFTVYGSTQAVLVAASTAEQKTKWIIDISKAAKNAAYDPPVVNFNDEFNFEALQLEAADHKQNFQKSNTTIQVCWHRNTCIGIDEYLLAARNRLSGYLLRKFKNSNGWQKLWVVYTNFCMFFYKSFQKDFPLAGLPLLGYSIATPSPTDGIKKEFVFKVQFKYHVYFFRAENEHSFNRWMEVIGCATTEPESLLIQTDRLEDSYDAEWPPSPNPSSPA